MAKALSGTRILQFHSNLGAAYATMLLAEQGGDVVLVEPVGGAKERGTPHFQVLNRSKRSVMLDLESRDSRTTLESMVRRADVAITGFTPARLIAHGLDYQTLRATNPYLLALNLPPFGGRGPEADFEANDDLVAARSGITGSQWARSGNPVALTFPAASYSAGVLGASATVAALYDRESRGEGQAIEVSILAGALSLQTGSVLRHEKMTTLYHGPQDPLGPIPCYRLFEAADGKYLFVACGNATFWGKFAIAIDKPELVSDPRFENAPWGIPQDHWQPLKDIIEPIIRIKPREEWLRILREADVPCAPVLTREEFINHPQTIALGMRREVHDPALGETVQMGVPVGLIATPGGIAGPAPLAADVNDPHKVFVDTRTANGEAPPSIRGDAPGVRSRKGPLAGVLVLDFASYIAGSYGPMILAQLGAEVIKIESLEGDSFRHFGFGFLGWNQGKRGLALDLTSREGLEIVHKLADKADVLVENLRPGRMARFGLDYEALAKRNPRLIYMSVNAFGNTGPEHNQPGFDPLLQARSGVMAAQGGPHADPVYLTCAICDYGAAMLSAFACILALRARQASGRGQFCETSLLQAAMAMQAGEFAFYRGRPDMENGSPESRGRSALSRAYQCADDEWLFVSVVSETEWRSLSRIAGNLPKMNFAEAPKETSEGQLAAAVALHFKNASRNDALARLSLEKIPATPVNHVKELFEDAQINANELLVELSHSQWGKVWQTGELMKFSATPGSIERAAPLHGEHTDEILREYLSMEASQLADLRSRRIIK